MSGRKEIDYIDSIRIGPKRYTDLVAIRAKIRRVGRAYST